MPELVFPMRNADICAGLSALWIKASLKKGQRVTSVFEIAKNAEEATGAQMQYAALVQSAKGTGLLKFVDAIGLRLCDFVVEDYTAASDVAKAVLRHTGYMLLSFGPTGAAGHAIGLRRHGAEQLVFEPNEGLFECSGDRELAARVEESVNAHSSSGAYRIAVVS